MNNAITRFALDIEAQNSQEYVHVRKGDTTRALSVNLRASGRPYEIASGVTVKLAAALANGTYKYGDCTVNGNSIEAVIPSAFTNAAGELLCCFILGEDTAALYTPSFTILVDEPAAPMQT